MGSSCELSHFNLLDTETLYSLATQNILDETGVKREYTWDVKQTLMGLQREEVSKKIVEIYDIPLTWEEYMNRQQEQIEILMQNAQLMPGNWKCAQILLIFGFVFFSFFHS